MPKIGEVIGNLTGVRYGDVSKIAEVSWTRYRTCRGRASRNELVRMFNLLMDLNADEDERLDAVCDGLWDLLMHQYTMYSITPIALQYLLSTTTPVARQRVTEAERFVSLCAEIGSQSVFLYNKEILLNKLGLLPIFSIEDVISEYA